MREWPYWCRTAKRSGMKKGFVSSALFVAAALAHQTSALANDSAAELSIGGLKFTPTTDMSMESEELRIALDGVSVRYQFANLSGKPVTLTVAFPLPDIDLSESDSIALPAG